MNTCWQSPAKEGWFCPSCHQKKVQVFGAMLAESILAFVPHRHFTFTIPKMLRPYFRFHRGLLKQLCRIAHQCVRDFLRDAFGDADGVGNAAHECQDIERFAQYIVRNPFSIAKMQVNRLGDSILYRSGMNAKIKRNFQVFSACDFIAAITQHIPDKRFQMVRYFGWYSNKMRGQRRKRPEEAKETAVHNSAATAQQRCGALASAAIKVIEHRACTPRRIPSRSWRELIKKVWEVDPLQCPYDIPASSRDAPRVADQRRADYRAHLAACWHVGE